MSADAGSRREFVVLRREIDNDDALWRYCGRVVALAEIEAIETCALDYGAGTYAAIPTANFRSRRVEMVPVVDSPTRVDRPDAPE